MTELVGAAPVIAEIGEITATSTTITTPTGSVALRGSQWTAADRWEKDRRTPGWAKIVAFAAIVVTLGLSLLLLLIKHDRYRATVTISIANGPFLYTAHYVVSTPAQVQAIYDQINYVRRLATL